MTADLALAADPGFLERSADPAEFVIQACERAKVWLREALEHGDIDQIVMVKTTAEVVRVYTMQKQLGKDAQLSAAELVRRAERGIGVAIRRGQATGEIRRQNEHSGNQYTVRHGAGVSNGPSKPSPRNYAKPHELSPGNGQVGIYDLTDGVSDDDFDAAVDAAKAEGNLSRANVARKARARVDDPQGRPDDWIPEPGDNHGDAPVQRRKLIRAWAAQGYSSRQMSERLGMNADKIRQIARELGFEIAADAVIKNTHAHDSSRIVRETVHTLEGLVMGIELVDLDQIDAAEAKDWAVSLSSSTRTLNRFMRQIREIAQ